ncbi:GNAT family N-acetyltransferase [Mesorhizobium sp. BAC0120]|uniref:GNAT family N-acetyltransferase n=1 Tax=Mesorhizobium sp. BAC0120 TaxID=3090670 RepID=UPI00298D325C|nr:GNAT family N-acetyltransferase [Mesorhizobium sp. BAC0120]MDW6026463.1 GNAT family N-acetyltransferase [Mesorhizobium sp. BAC0120]
MSEADISIRRATELDQPAIRALARTGQLNRTDVKWSSCWVATAAGQQIVGIVQMRRHSDGSHELGPLVVRKEMRGQGVAKRLMDALVAAEPGPVWMVTAHVFTAVCKRWGFRPIEAPSAPVEVRRNQRMSSLARVFRMRQPTRPLIILERLPA